MKIVSAEWVHEPDFNSWTIKATLENGDVFWIPSANSDVPPWPEYLEAGGTISGEPPPEAKPA